MYEALLWWVVVQILGIVALPFTFLLFSKLPDRGFPFSKPLGILVLSYFFWLGGMFHILPNARGSGIVLIVIFLFAALFVLSRCRDELVRFVRDNRRLILIEEGLFLAAFLLWALVRAYNPEIRATEQPMDFGFMNAIFRSEYFPPNDPWLAGYSISYYYFGYLMLATLAKISGIATSVAYNLSLAMLFGLVAAGAFSVIYNLVVAHRSGEPGVGTPAGKTDRRWLLPVAMGLVGALFVVGIGNLEGALEFARAHSLGTLEFWRWIGIKDALQPYSSPQWYPTENWWWWRATRVINSLTYTFDTRGVLTAVNDSADYTISEFPFFSFLLGDLHPHVMALPFALLAVALSLNVLWQGAELSLDWLRGNPWRVATFALALGALGFLNSWDFPTYAALFIASAAVGMYLAKKVVDRELLKTAGALAAAVGVGGIVLYLPFYVGFQSQASGILPVVGPGTQLTHFVIIWGLFLVILAAFAIVLVREKRGEANVTPNPHWWPVLAMVGLVAVWAILAAGADSLGFLKDQTLGDFLAGRAWRLLPILVMAMGGLVVLDLWLRPSGESALRGWETQPKGGGTKGDVPQVRKIQRQGEGGGPVDEETSPLRDAAGVVAETGGVSMGAVGVAGTAAGTTAGRYGTGTDVHGISVAFVLLLMVVGFALTLGCELFFIHDVFGRRMNTVFKLYYQAWLLLALASGFGLYYVGLRLFRTKTVLLRLMGEAWLAVVAVLLIGALLYPLGSIISKTGSFAGRPTLDGIAYVKKERPGEYEAIQWLDDNAPTGTVIVEAASPNEYWVAGDYARVAVYTGFPNILGWAGHEWQWRGSDKAYAGRAEDVDTIYRSMDRGQVQGLLRKYNVTYVYAGYLERDKYGQPALDKFASFADTVFKNETTTIYKVRR